MLSVTINRVCRLFKADFKRICESRLRQHRRTAIIRLLPKNNRLTVFLTIGLLAKIRRTF